MSYNVIIYTLCILDNSGCKLNEMAEVVRYIKHLSVLPYTNISTLHHSTVYWAARGGYAAPYIVGATFKFWQFLTNETFKRQLWAGTFSVIY